VTKRPLQPPSGWAPVAELVTMNPSLGLLLVRCRPRMPVAQIRLEANVAEWEGPERSHSAENVLSGGRSTLSPTDMCGPGAPMPLALRCQRVLNNAALREPPHWYLHHALWISALGDFCTG
jgi:hypothetical protein